MGWQLIMLYFTAMQTDLQKTQWRIQGGGAQAQMKPQIPVTLVFIHSATCIKPPPPPPNQNPEFTAVNTSVWLIKDVRVVSEKCNQQGIR